MVDGASVTSELVALHDELKWHANMLHTQCTKHVYRYNSTLYIDLQRNAEA